MTSSTPTHRQQSSKTVIKSATHAACTQMFESLETRTLFSTYTVTTAADSGSGSLRDAIVKSNASVGKQDTIKFNIPGSNPTIFLNAALPDITDRVTIDGGTQKGGHVGINGAGAGTGAHGLALIAAKSDVRGLAIGGFDGAGIKITGNGNIVRSSYIGLDVTSNVAVPNKLAGILVDHAADTRIGTSSAANNGADANFIGGNAGDNLRLQGALRTQVIGNAIGAFSVINNGDGIASIGSTQSKIAQNFFSDISGNGITLSDSHQDLIVSNAMGLFAPSNGGDGIRVINGSSDETIGGTSDELRNYILGNGGAGVNVISGDRITIRGNAFQDNTGLAIDLNGDGPTNNDAGDIDGGANGSQNFPVISQISPLGIGVKAHVTFMGKPSTKYTVDFYNGYVPDAGGRGDGTFLFTATLTTDAAGAFAGDLSGVGDRPLFTQRSISCMVTDGSGNSSELSAPLFLADQAPTASDNSDFTLLNQPVKIDVVANDTDPDRDALLPISASVPLHGTVSFVNNELIYTPNIGFIGTDTFTYTMTDGQGMNDTANVTVTVAAPGSSNLIPDPSDPSQNALLVYGTSKGDTIEIQPAANGAKISLNGKSAGTFNFTGKIIVEALDGDDHVNVSSSVNRSAWIAGGKGNDTLTGGSRDDLLLGGDGADHLFGKGGRDILIGGHQGDSLDGGDSDDLLVAGPSKFDDDFDSFTGIAKEWSRTDLPFAERLDHIQNYATGGFNTPDHVLNFLTAHSGSQPVDTLTGGSGRDGFFYNFDQSGKYHDRVTDKTSSDDGVDIGLT